MLILSVTQPCHEKWEEMTPADRGVFCQSCSKHVIDFSAMADEDILDYFQKREGQPVCGRFRNSQLNRPLINISPSVFSMDIPLWKKFLAAVLICFAAFITGCSSGERDYTALQVPPVVVEQPSVHAEDKILNVAEPVTPNEQSITPKQQSKTVTGKKQKKKGKHTILFTDIDFQALIAQNKFDITVAQSKSDITHTYGFTTGTWPVASNDKLLPVPFPDLKKITPH
jgi:hypothetical protein